MGKKMNCSYKVIVAVIIINLSLVGCSHYKSKETKLALFKTIHPEPTVIDEEKTKDLKTLKKVRHEIISIEPIYDVAVIKGGKDTIVAYKVKHLHRFKMKQIEKEINQKLEKKFPKEDFTISSDYKIFLEVIELINEEKDPKFSDKKANKKIQEIITLKKELT